MSRGGDYIYNLFQDQARAFNEEYPDVRVEIDNPTTDWFQKFQTLTASGSPIDALFHCDCSLGTSAREGSVEDLGPYLARQKDYREADFEKGSWFACTYGGKRYGLPWDSGAYAVAYNVDMFQASSVPLPDPKRRPTWDELLTIARRLTIDAGGRRSGEPGFDPAGVKQYGFNTNDSWGLATFIFGNGGEVLAPDGKVPVDTPAAIEAIQFVADLRAKHFVSSGPKFPPPQPVAFENNNLAMVHQGVWQLGRYNAARVRWGAFPAPVKKGAVSGGHYSPLSMARASQQKDATWAWIYFATLSERGQTMLVDAGQMQPMRKSLAARFTDTDQPPDKPSRQVFVDELKDATLRVVGDRTGSYWGSFKNEWGQVWTPVLTPVWKGEKQAAQVAPDLRRYTEELLRTGQVPVIT
jgi:multiple sugar transport system substrate-binding protein